MIKGGIDGMVWVTPQFTRGSVERAGRLVASAEEQFSAESYQARVEAWEVFQNWRAAHAYPLNTFQITLRARAKRINPQAVTAQRLKRAPSILAKLARFEKMSLARMQDIGGCRAVMKDIREVMDLRDVIEASRTNHVAEAPKDYISNPKDDGYRGIHLIYKYMGRGERTIYDGLRIEIQLRTRLQHAWATTVETVGFFRREALKSGYGDAAWRDFFICVSQAFAHIEGVGAPEVNIKDLYGQITSAYAALGVRNRLLAYRHALKHTNEHQEANFFLLKLDMVKQVLTVRGFQKSQATAAQAAYEDAEMSMGDNGDVVLVAAESALALRKAYPNYFADTSLFMSTLAKITKT